MEVFNRRAHVMRAVPVVFRGAFRSALKLAMQEIVDGPGQSEDLVRVHPCVEVVLLVAQDAAFFVSPREERFGTSNQVGGKVPTISVW